jgi:uncharacterized lipoprotein YajG
MKRGIAVALGGCSNVTDETVALAPPAMTAATPQQGAEKVGLSVVAVDKRAPPRDRIANKNGVAGAKVVASNDVVDLVREAVEQELRATGFARGGGLVVTVELESFYGLYGGGQSTTVRAQVAFTLRVRAPSGETVAVAHYEGGATAQPAFLTQEALAAKTALEQALGIAVTTLRYDRAFKAKLLTPVNQHRS